MNRFYAGIGSRETPPNILDLMTQLGALLALRGFVLRSGAAPGADAAFERGCDLNQGAKQIYVPWYGFQNRRDNDMFVIVGNNPEAMKLAAQFHPAWHRCSPAAKKLHARNCYQILGLQLDTPVERVVCWTPNGSGSGGTGQAIRIARHFNIPVDDLGKAETLNEYLQDIQKLKGTDP